MHSTAGHCHEELYPAGGLEDYAIESTVGLLNYHTIRNGFHLGHTEFRDLAAAVDWTQLQDLSKLVINTCLQPKHVEQAIMLLISQPSQKQCSVLMSKCYYVTCVHTV